MKVGLIGLPGSGKTTLFYALTRGEGSPAGGGSSAIVSVVPVPDARYDFGVKLFNPKKRTPATVEFTDGAAQITAGEGRAAQKFGSDFFVGIRSVDALVLVVRAFESPSHPAPDGGLNPLKEYNAVTEELLLGDLTVIENRLERIEKQLKTRKQGMPGPEVTEREVLFKIKAALDEFKPVATVELDEEERRIVKNFDFLTAKPLIAVANVGEDEIAAGDTLPLLAPLRDVCAEAGNLFITCCAAAEQEVAQLEPAEQRDFLDALGIDEPARDRLIRAAYRALGVMSFFTLGEDEVRAWTIPTGSTALIAAGRIHSDLARGFIRGELLAFDDLTTAGTWEAAKAAGKIRLEGKDYVVKDGDILHVRFKV
ncbi:MAG: redox-regulated ATPase YchF [Capsulimonadaceae bacterium]